jgi:DNA-directed RNA polymerase subunit L
MSTLVKCDWTVDDYVALNLPPFDKLLTAEQRAQVLSFLPDKAHYSQQVAYIMHNSSTSVANALRRAVIGDMTVRHMHVEIEDIDTNAKELRLVELQDRISLIPLDQSTPLTAKFMLDIKPKSVSDVPAWNCVGEIEVTAANLRYVGNDSAANMPFALSNRITLLQPDQYLKMHVSVREGRCDKRLIGGGNGPQTGAACSLTCQFEFQERDHVTIFCLTDKGDIESRRVNTAALISYAVKVNKEAAAYIKAEADAVRLIRLNILLVENIGWYEAADIHITKRISNFQFRIENANTDGSIDSNWPRFISSAEEESSSYYMKFFTNGNMSAKNMMIHACDDLIERLGRLADVTAAKAASVIQTELIGQESEGGEIVEINRFTILAETHTMGRLIEQFIFMTDPSVGLINYHMPHPQSRRIIVNIIHPEPIKLFERAIKAAIADISGLRSAFLAKMSESKPATSHAMELFSIIDGRSINERKK